MRQKGVGPLGHRVATVGGEGTQERRVGWKGQEPQMAGVVQAGMREPRTGADPINKVD